MLQQRLTVVVVLADEDDRQVPQPRHVERLKALPLVGRAITIPTMSPMDSVNILPPKCPIMRTLH